MADEKPVEATDGETGCTRCDAPLIFLGRKDFHEGGIFFLPALFEGRTNVEMWACSDCGYVHLFMPQKRHSDDADVADQSP